MLNFIDIKASKVLCFDAMRTTLTLDDDVAAALERLRRRGDASYRDLVNEALRAGLKHMTTGPRKPGTFRTKAVSLGGSRLASVDNVAEVLAIAEREAFR